jgi:hypothetical protein
MIWRTGTLVVSKARQLSAEAFNHLSSVTLNVSARMMRQTQGGKRLAIDSSLSSRVGGINQWRHSQFNAST